METKSRDIVSLGPEQERWQNLGLEPLRYCYKLKPNDIVFDVGSYRREFADKIAHKFKCKVLCFDALDNTAAGTQDGYLEVGGNYLYTSHYDFKNRHLVKCCDLARVVKEQKEVALMKMNIEGYEYELIPHLIISGVMERVKNLQVQFHLIEGKECEKLYETIFLGLSITHKITWRYPFVWESWERKYDMV